MGTEPSPLDVTTTTLGFWLRVALRSRMNTPKNGTSRLFGVDKALARAFLYSSLVCLDSSAAARKSSCGSFSLSVIDSQNGFSLSDLPTRNKRTYFTLFQQFDTS